MKYTWSFNQKALKDFKKNLDKPVQRRIIRWLDEHIEGADNPRIWGKKLSVGPLTEPTDRKQIA